MARNCGWCPEDFERFAKSYRTSVIFFLLFKIFIVLNFFFFLDRKELELALQEDSDGEDDNVLNLVETDGMLWPTVENLIAS